jgi:hypothetical protein
LLPKHENQTPQASDLVELREQTGVEAPAAPMNLGHDNSSKGRPA